MTLNDMNGFFWEIYFLRKIIFEGRKFGKNEQGFERKTWVLNSLRTIVISNTFDVSLLHYFITNNWKECFKNIQLS